MGQTIIDLRIQQTFCDFPQTEQLGFFSSTEKKLNRETQKLKHKTNGDFSPKIPHIYF